MGTAVSNIALGLSKIKSILNIVDHQYGDNDQASIQLGKWEIIVNQHINLDRNCYSKGWHRKYGAKVTVSDRTITFKKRHGRGFITKSQNLMSWAGNWLENSIVLAKLEPESTVPLSIRLHKAFDAVHVKTLRGHKIYQRTLLGEPVDWVIVAPMGTTYHSSEYKELIRGLYNKIRASAKAKFTENYIDWKACKALGFCDQGIKAFCHDFGLNKSKQYTPSQIADIVRANLGKAMPYIEELKTLAAAYNYKFEV